MARGCVIVLSTPAQSAADSSGLLMPRYLFGAVRRTSLVVTFAAAATLVADPRKLPPPAARAVDYASDVRPILAAHCYACHGPDKQKSGLRLDVKVAALKGGDTGRAILPGRSAESRLVRFVAGLDADMVMPPKGERLSAEQVGVLRAWIDQGADWPDAGTAAGPTHWAFGPPRRPAVPDLRNPEAQTVNPIDRFVRVRLAKEGLEPA